MLDKWSNIVVAGELPELLIVVSLISGQDCDRLCVPFLLPVAQFTYHAFALSHVNIENGVGRCIDQ